MFAYISPLQPAFVAALPPAEKGAEQGRLGKSPEFNLKVEENIIAVVPDDPVVVEPEATAPDDKSGAPKSDSKRLPENLHQHFVFDEPKMAERDPHMASVEGKKARQRQ